MAQMVYLIKTMSEMQAAWEELKRDDWESTIICIHEDLLNLDVKNRVLPMLRQQQVRDLELHWVEPETAYLKVSTGRMSGLELTYYVQIQQIVFERGMHAVCLSYTEEVDKNVGMGHFVNVLLKTDSGKSCLQMIVKDHPMLRVTSNQIIIDLDQWPAFRQVCDWTYHGKKLGNDLEIQSMGMVNRCLCLKFSWRTE